MARGIVGMETAAAPPAAQTTPRFTALIARLGLTWVPGLALQTAGAFFLVSLANMGARAEAPWAEGLFWLGLGLLYVPVGLALLAGRMTRSEIIGAIVILGVGMFLCEAVTYPLGPASFDELLHTRTAQDVIESGRLFGSNPLLPVSPYYPGLENVTTALRSLSQLDLWPSSIVVLGIGRVLFMLSIFLFVEAFATSSRLAGLAALVYAANPRFLYFDSQFAYESLGLPLAAFVLATVAMRSRQGSSRLELPAIVLATLACVVTHPVTSAMLGAFLVLWTVARLILGIARRRHRPSPSPVLVALFAVGAAAAWAFLVAPPVLDYIGPPVTRATTEIIELVSGEADTRTIFQSASGEVAPVWERVVGLGSVAVLTALLPFGLLEAWRRYRHSPVAWALAIVALGYPLALAGRLSPLGAEIAARTPEFLFLGVGFCIAAFLTRRRSPEWRSWRWSLLVAGAATVVLIGGVIVGVPRWARLPGRYLVSADARSLEPNGIAAARWARAELGPDHRMVGDRTNRVLMGVYGHQEVLLANNSRVNLSAFYRSFAFGAPQRRLVAEQRVQFAVVDLRLTMLLPTVGFYFQKQELDAGSPITPLRAAGLGKFDTEPGLDRVFDNGEIRIYDVSSLGRPVSP